MISAEGRVCHNHVMVRDRSVLDYLRESKAQGTADTRCQRCGKKSERVKQASTEEAFHCCALV